ncbi:hypothetical protein [Streptomyces sp. NPDC060198]|uniref:hypothetical protein n=1 Tax=Streptomyces sp. NPDC060198 TaxID=3347070 RepID=UPI0036558F37
MTPPDAEDAEARRWEERLGWTYGLTADDPGERSTAIALCADARRATDKARDRMYATWRSTARFGRWMPWRQRARLRAQGAYDEARSRTLPHAVWLRPSGDIRAWPGLPYALLFLEWEARYPRDWTRHAKDWGTKQGLLRGLAVAGHGETVRSKLTDLVEVVVRRPYRCKDREYVRVARAVDSADLRARLEAVARSDAPWARQNAGYVLWALEHPDAPSTVHAWRNWHAADTRE